MKRRLLFLMTMVLFLLVSTSLIFSAGQQEKIDSTMSEKTVEVEPPAELASEGIIRYAATLDNPPRAYYETDGSVAGFEVELGEEIASRMGLEVRWEQYSFDGLITSLQAENVDAIVQELFIKAEREEVINMLPFGYSAQSIVVPKGNPQNLQSIDDLSSKKVAVPNGTTIHNILLEENERLQSNGKKEINLIILETTTDSFQQLEAGQVDAVGTTNTAAAFYVNNAPDRFEITGDSFGRILDGIGVKLDNLALTKAMWEALINIYNDGTYNDLLEKWNLQGAGLSQIPPADYHRSWME